MINEETAALLRRARRAEDRARELRGVSEALVAEAKVRGASWTDVGRAFGITRQSAHQRFVAAVYDRSRVNRKGH